MQLHNTSAIVLRTIPYGDTSIIVTALTEKFGIQLYIVKGARKTNSKGKSLAQYFQPTAQLDLVVYNQPSKNFQFIKEVKWQIIYQNILEKVLHNTVAIYISELLFKCIKEAEENQDLYDFVKESINILDEAEMQTLINMPIYFALHLAEYLGFKIENNFDNEHQILDWHSGVFIDELPTHGNHLTAGLSVHVSAFLKTNNPITLYRIKTNRIERQQILQGLETFYKYHVSDFTSLKSLPILMQILD